MDGSPIPRAPRSQPPVGGARKPYPQPGSLETYTYYVYGSTDRETLKRGKQSKQVQQATVAGDGDVIRVVYGRALLGAQIAGVLMHNGELILLAVWCQGEIDAIEQVYINGEPIPNWINATHYLGTSTQLPDPTIVAARAAKGFPYTDTLRGTAYSVVRILPSKNSGFPRLMAKVRGLRVRDAIDSARVWSDNPAYALADFIESEEYGLGRSVDWSTVATVAAACDELVGSPGERKRTIDLSLDASQPGEVWLGVLRDYAGCWAIPEGRSYRLVADAPASSSKVFDASNIVGRGFKVAKRGTVNAATVIDVVYTDTTVMPWRDQVVTVSAPGVAAGTVPRRVSRIQKPGTTRYSDAYRYAVERLNASLLNDLTVRFVAFDSALECQVGDVVEVTHPVGLTSKLVRIMSIGAPEPGRWSILAQEYDPARYSSSVVTGPTTPDTSLPSAWDVPEVSGFIGVEDVFQMQTGRFGSRFTFLWTGPTLATYIYLRGFTLTVTDENGTERSYELPVDATNFTTEALPENLTYTCSIVARSAYAVGPVASFVITNNGKLARPSDVPSASGYSVNGTVYLTWVSALDHDLTAHEIRWGPTGGDWESATLLERVAAPALAYESTVVPEGTWRFWFKGLDQVRTDAYPNGQESVNATPVDIEVVPSTTSSSVNYTPGGVTLTNMVAFPPGGWITGFSEVWSDLFPSVMSSYTRPIASYHGAGTSSLVSDAVDAGESAPSLVTVTLDYTDLEGAAQVYIEHKVLVGDSWTRVDGANASVTARYFRVGIECDDADHAFIVSELGVIRVTRDTTERFLRDTVGGDALFWMM